MKQPILHLIIDPLCGWTYAAGPLMEQSLSVPNLSIQVHGGGMLTGERLRQITSDWRAYVMPHDQQIETVSGQPFGAAYYNTLLNDTSVILDSTPPTIAILIAQNVTGNGVDMLKQIQHAYFFEGKKVFEFDVLSNLASLQNIPPSQFRDAYDQYTHHIQEQIIKSRHLLQQIGGQGFPSAALESDGQYQLLDISRFYGKPHEWFSYLNKHLAQNHRQLIEEII